MTAARSKARAACSFTNRYTVGQRLAYALTKVLGEHEYGFKRRVTHRLQSGFKIIGHHDLPANACQHGFQDALSERIAVDHQDGVGSFAATEPTSGDGRCRDRQAKSEY